MDTRKAVVVCGPTASGKSELADALADSITAEHGVLAQTIAVDSMQVYREIPTITNQARRRPAELVGIVPVTEEWTVARHAARAQELMHEAKAPCVLDAGTGMYLNATILDVPLAPKVDAGTRRLAESLTATAPNPRRAAREKELELWAAEPRGSIWGAELRYEVTMIYLRPESHPLDAAIRRRSERIVSAGLDEARRLAEMREAGAPISASVLDAIGVRELLQHLSGDLTLQDTTTRISTRTRQLARRQRRWFDKLARNLSPRVPTKIVDAGWDINTMHKWTLRGRMGP